jgi:hypothetical protein
LVWRDGHFGFPFSRGSPLQWKIKDIITYKRADLLTAFIAELLA